MDEDDYVKRLEKIIDKQDDLLTHLDAKFQQQEALNETLSNQNKILREDIKKHKGLLMDMNKTVNQHKNVVKKLKKELEDQLKIQQDLHKDYGQVIKELTDELEEERGSVKSKPDDNDSSNDDKVELPPKEYEKDYVAEASGFVSDLKEKSTNVIKDLGNEPPVEKNQFCKNCGAELKEGFLFCDSCGHKID